MKGMRPVHALVMVLIFLGVVAFSYFSIWGLKLIDKATHDHYSGYTHRQSLFSDRIRSACLNYAVEYNRLPPDSDNKRLTVALTGDNARHIQFLWLTQNETNADGEMIDQWGTPLKVTFYDTSGIQVASAGPDKVFGTSDDIVSNPPSK